MEGPEPLAVHENVVPLTLELSPIEVELPLQIVCVEGEAVTFGIGFTVTTTFCAVPEQPLAVGVTV